MHETRTPTQTVTPEPQDETNLPPVHPPALAEFLVETVIPTNPDGFTIDPHTWIMPALEKDEYIVALAGRGQVLSRCSLTSEVEHWLSWNSRFLLSGNHFVGGWRNPKNRLFHLDISFTVRGLDRAFAEAHRNGQTMIYHAATDLVITCEHPIQVQHSRTYRGRLISSGPVGPFYFGAAFDENKCIAVVGPAANGATAIGLAQEWIDRADDQRTRDQGVDAPLSRASPPRLTV